MALKPQFVVQGPGVHNQNLKGTTARLTRGGSWKKQRIVVIMPCADLIPARVVLSWVSLAFPPNNAVHRILALGQEVGEAYDNALADVMANPVLSTWEYLLTVEHDNAPQPDGVLRLVERLETNKDLAAVGGLYFCKGPGGCAQIWGDPKDHSLGFEPQLPDPDGGLVECRGLGMGFTLFRLSMFKDKKFKRPWFKTQKDATGIASQDLYFWRQAHALGHRCAVDCSTTVGHYDMNGEVGGEPDVMW